MTAVALPNLVLVPSLRLPRWHLPWERTKEDGLVLSATPTEIGSSAVSANPATPITATSTASVAVGEIVFYIVSVFNSAGTLATATATAGGNAMTQDGSTTRGIGNVVTFLFRYEPGSTLATSSTFSATITNGAQGSSAKIVKVAGLTTGLGLDATLGSNNGLSQTPTTGASGTPPGADEVFALAILGAPVGTAGQATVTTAGYTPLTEVVQATRLVSLNAAWQDLPAAVAAQNVAWSTTWGANKSWSGMVALYQVSGGVAPPTADETSVHKMGQLMPNTLQAVQRSAFFMRRWSRRSSGLVVPEGT